jgi:2-C-methyl-D-erythritol 4-phosphate cytidylyltransferase/2-C-methyl-D-erythritol 2,4-cyclodiphosphate synthase
LPAELDVVVVAAGQSTRMRGVDKVFVPVAGVPLLAHCLDVFERSPLVERVAVVVSEGNLARTRELVTGRGLTRSRTIVTGGPRRQDSVRRGMEALDRGTGAGAARGDGDRPAAPWIAVHDGARPFIDEAMLERALAAVRETGAAIAAVPVRDTIKQVGGERVIEGTPRREGLWAAQTPQVFRADLLERAHRTVTEDVTDDSAMVERIGGRVVVFEGSPWNIKVTTPEDLVFAEALAHRRTRTAAQGIAAPEPTDRGAPSAAAQNRYGTGFDGHRLAEGGPLRLGGTDIPFELHLEGHSDGDVLLHAIASAVLGAAGLGDLGRHFPSSDPSLKGIDSRLLLRRAVALARDAGWELEFVDATIIAQRPKLAPYLEAIGRAVSETVALRPDQVNIKATSTDEVGAIGRGEGIAAQAIATVRK